MEISKHKVVTISYTLTDDGGAVIESSKGSGPFSYIHGVGATIPGLEDALEGKSTGDTLTVSIPPEQAYGERNESLVQIVPRARFETSKDLEVGMRFQTSAEAGAPVVTVIQVDGDEITIDGNHPLAGTTLVFAVAVVDVRDATSEEISHGHIHGTDTPPH